MILSNNTPALVDVDWVLAHGQDKDVVLVDLRDRLSYTQGHIPGAVQTNYGRGGWRVRKGDVAGLLPEQPVLEKKIGDLGISAQTHVVFVPKGLLAAEMAGAARMYWTFRLLGHERLSILDGGMVAYVDREGMTLATGDGVWKSAVYESKKYTAILAHEADVQDALSNGLPLLDSRPTDQHLGINRTADVIRYGTLPGAIGLAGQWLTEDGGGQFRDSPALRRLYGAVGADPDRPALLFCNTGHWSSLGWFVHSELLGNGETPMYDASMAEWSRLDPATHPMELRYEIH